MADVPRKMPLDPVQKGFKCLSWAFHDQPNRPIRFIPDPAIDPE